MRKVRHYLFILVMAQVAVLAIIYTFSYARYISNSVFNYYLESKSFYFTSDYLEQNTVQNVNNIWNGEDIYFNIKNSINDEAVSEVDINYTATCSAIGLEDNIDCFINDKLTNTDSGTISLFRSCVNNTEDGVDVDDYSESDCNLGGYTWKNHPMENQLYFRLVPKNGYQMTDVEVLVDVSSTSPYHKSLKGKYILHKIDEIEGKIIPTFVNNDSYVRLTLSNTYLENKCVKVGFNSSNIRVDKNDDFSSMLTDDENNIKEFKINVNSRSNYSLMFYKVNFEINYDISDFVIEESSGC